MLPTRHRQTFAHLSLLGKAERSSQKQKTAINSRGMSNPIPAPFGGAWQLMVRNPFWTCLGPLKPNGFQHDFFFPLKKSEIKNGYIMTIPLILDCTV